jgi:dTMP kinase
LLITFEGIDGSGKSTQIEQLRNFLQKQDRKTVTFREPGGTAVSEKIRSILLDSSLEPDSITELFLFSAARSQLMSEKVLPLLEKGHIVILDRFYDSTTAYQGYGREDLDLADIHHINKIASHHTSPDLTFYLKISLHEGRKRSTGNVPDRMEQSDDDFYKRVIEGFEELADRHSRIITLDAEKEQQKVTERMIREVKKHL